MPASLSSTDGASSPAFPVEVIRSEFLRGNRPIVGAEMAPYILVRDATADVPVGSLPAESDGESSQPAVAMSGEEYNPSRVDGPLHKKRLAVWEATDGDPRVRWRWFRGPRVYNCVFHPQRPGVVRDVARSLRFYCSAECLNSGYKHLPDEQCAMVPDPMEDDLMYCPWLIESGSGKPGRKCWVPVGDNRGYTPTPDDSERILAVEVTVGVEKNGSGEWIFDQSACQRGCNTSNSLVIMTGPTFDPSSYTPPLREMLSVYGALEHIQTGQAIKLLNWNILADIYASEQMYDYCPPWALCWDYRRHLILKQIAALEGDIVCLQEVQNDHLSQFLLPNMESCGFGYLYAPKTRQIFTNKYTTEGCALFYRKSRFVLRDQIVIEFDNIAKERFSDKGQISRLTKGNVALCAILEDQRYSGRVLAVCNTHITADVEAGDVKLWQTQMLVDQVQHWVSERTRMHNTPLIVCGDFNSTPESPVYELLTSGQIGQHHLQQIEDPCVVLQNTAFGHAMLMRSIHVAVVGHEAQTTNYTKWFQGVLDYIFFSAGTLQGLAVSNGYPVEDLQRDTALPSPSQPSDHILTVGVFTYQ